MKKYNLLSRNNDKNVENIGKTIDEVGDLDDLDDLAVDNAQKKNDGVLRDSTGNEVVIENPMWKRKPDERKSGVLSWARPPGHMSVSDWVLTITLAIFPIINIFALLMWAFFSDTAPDEKRNFAKACIIIMLMILFSALLIGVLKIL